MTDHAGEQAMELEALEAILMDDLEEYEGMLPPGWTNHGQTYKVTIHPLEDLMGGDGASGDEDELELELLFAHTPQYPDEAPCLKPRSVRGISDADIRDLQSTLDGVVQENLGMAMVYNLVTAAQEWLAHRLQQRAGPDPEADRKREEEEEERRHAELRAHGQPVTVESFAAWKKRFEAEMAALKAQGAAADGGKGGGGGGEQRLTGKAWFMKQVAAGEVVSGSEEEEEEGEEGLEEEEGAGAASDEDEDEDLSYEDDDDDEEDDDEMLDSYLSGKAGAK